MECKQSSFYPTSSSYVADMFMSRIFSLTFLLLITYFVTDIHHIKNFDFYIGVMHHLATTKISPCKLIPQKRTQDDPYDQWYHMLAWIRSVTLKPLYRINNCSTQLYFGFRLFTAVFFGVLASFSLRCENWLKPCSLNAAIWHVYWHLFASKSHWSAVKKKLAIWRLCVGLFVCACARVCIM